MKFREIWQIFYIFYFSRKIKKRLLKNAYQICTVYLLASCHSWSTFWGGSAGTGCGGAGQSGSSCCLGTGMSNFVALTAWRSSCNLRQNWMYKYRQYMYWNIFARIYKLFFNYETITVSHIVVSLPFVLEQNKPDLWI